MSGYTPLFDSLTRGTLCGRWPDIGLWPIVLSLADKNGEVDVTPLYIAGITGLPEPQVVACMDRFCQPDPYSRSMDHEGRRLVLLDEHRSWGWQIVNHGKYKEKARLMGKNARAVESGQEAERKRHKRKSAEVRRSPPVSDPSDAYADTNTLPLPSEEADTVIWETGVQMLGGSQSCRSFLGKLAKEHGKEQLAQAIASAAVQRPVSPRDYLVAALQGRVQSTDPYYEKLQRGLANAN